MTRTGGARALEDAGVEVVRVMGSDADADATDADAVAEECRDLIKYFAKRISPRPASSAPIRDGGIDGKRRRALRSIAGRLKKDGKLQQIEWWGSSSSTPVSKDDDNDTDDDDIANRVPIDHRFLEAIDGLLWDREIVLLRLNNVVRKKRGAKILSGRVAEVLDARVVQVIGHTALLYRPAIPPVLDLDELVAKNNEEPDMVF